MTKTRVTRIKDIVAGIVIGLSLVALMQDLYGIEAYLARVREHWIATPWWLWLIVIIGLLVSLFYERT